jgi:hypothetical protein
MKTHLVRNQPGSFSLSSLILIKLLHSVPEAAVETGAVHRTKESKALLQGAGICWARLTANTDDVATEL